MIWVAALLGGAAALFGFLSIEKKRKAAGGVLIYPIWRCNMLALWAVMALFFALLTGSVNLPRILGLVMHSAESQAVVKEVSREEHCHVTYYYKANGAAFTGSDNLCGLAAGEAHPVYFDTGAPSSSTLYPPEAALKNELLAMALISLGLPAFLVLWFRATYLIGSRRKS